MSIEDSNLETVKHIVRIHELARKLVRAFVVQISTHDQSKLESPEAEGFHKILPRMKEVEFGSEEYEECKVLADEAIQHHYQHNRHHPEHHKRGVNDMNLIDILEMFVDWKAASERNKDGSLEKSIQYCCSKYEINPQLEEIFLNSIHLLEE